MMPSNMYNFCLIKVLKRATLCPCMRPKQVCFGVLFECQNYDRGQLQYCYVRLSGLERLSGSCLCSRPWPSASSLMRTDAWEGKADGKVNSEDSFIYCVALEQKSHRMFFRSDVVKRFLHFWGHVTHHILAYVPHATIFLKSSGTENSSKLQL
jgi:hypothetical protein